MSERRIPLSEPNLVGNAAAYLQECLTTNFVSSVGPFVERFERELAAYVGAKHAVACASGTAALHVALRVVGVEPGDEVWVPSFTFVASANPVVYLGATPVLVDAEAATWNLDPAIVVDELARRARTGAKQPKVIEVAHILGHPAELAPIAEACAKHGVTIVEDAAEALGARYTTGALAGRHVGTIGKLGCFSFNGNKIITTGGGGMIVTDDEQLAKRAKHLTTQARLPGRAYMHDDVGYNYRLTNLAAALGVAQLEQLPAFLAAKLAIADRYDAALAGTGLTTPPRAAWATPSHWLYSVLSPERDRLVDRLSSTGIEARPVWTPLHQMPIYAGAPRLGDGAVAARIAATGLSLPSSPQLTAEDQERVLATLRAAL